jgi:hypothetical protein
MNDDALRLLRAVGARHIVASVSDPAPAGLPLVAEFGKERVYAVPDGERSREVSSGSATPVRASPAGLLLDLGTPREIRRIAFQISDAPWVRRPILAFSDDGAAWTELYGFASLGDAALSLYRDPRRGKGEVRFAPTVARYVRLDPRLPARSGTVGVD